jgi:hypothetical protein
MPGARRAVAALLPAVGWFALVLQLGIMLRNAATDGTGLLAAAGSFLSFFTVLSNLLVAGGLIATIPAAPPRALRPLIEPSGATALAVYITVVGVVYSLVLRQLWHPTGAQLVADIVLHEVMPSGYVIYWLTLVPKGRLHWRQVWPWLAFPAAYTVATLVRGALLQVYPYPFIDIAALGYRRVLGNMTLLFAGFLVLAWYTSPSTVSCGGRSWRTPRARSSASFRPSAYRRSGAT